MNRFGMLGAVLAASAFSLSGCVFQSKSCCCKGGHCCCEKEDKEEGNEVVVQMNDLPPAVRATLERESAGATVTEIEREIKNGRVVYSADVMQNGMTWDVVIAEDGSLISKIRDDEEDEEKD